MDSLPENAALGYLKNEETDLWCTNIYSLPVVGGSDGGLFTCADDINKLWRSIISYKLLSEDMTKAFLRPHIAIDDEGESYGLGVYHYNEDGKIAHFAVGAIMLKRDWMLRYVPPIVSETIPEYVTIAGYAWAALMFVLGAGTIGVAATGDLRLWTIYVSVVMIAAKVLAFAVQYVAFRIIITNRLRSMRA